MAGPTQSLTLYQVDAFTDVPFGGNPAAVVLVPPGTVVEDQLRQQIAAEMNLSETAYVEPLTDAGEPYATGGAAQAAFKTAQRYRLRWFTPTSEVALCGHATVASACALLQGEGNPADTLLFDTVHSGQLVVRRMNQDPQPLLQLDMPSRPPQDPLPPGTGPDSEFVKAVVGSAAVSEVVFNAALKYLLIRLASGSRRHLEAIAPDMQRLRPLQKGGDPVFGVIVTTAAEDDEKHEFLLRFWAPWTLDWEDPVTGSSYAVAGPYWAEALGKREMSVRQCSARGGELVVQADEEEGRVRVRGRSVVVITGQLHAPVSA